MYPFFTIFRFLINRTVVHVVLLMKILSNIKGSSPRKDTAIRQISVNLCEWVTTINRNQIKIIMAFAWAFEMASRISGDPQGSKVQEQAVC